MIKVNELTPEIWEKNSLELEEKFNDKSLWDTVPIYNSATEAHLKDHQFVRFVGMIQDMLNPEIYLRSFQVRDNTTGEVTVRSGMYRDYSDIGHATLVEGSAENVRDDRTIFYCVSVPGVNDWIRKIVNNRSSDLIGDLGLNNQVCEGSNGKRSFDEMAGNPEEGGEEPSDENGSNQPSKREQNVQSPINASLHIEGGDLNHPLKDPDAKACYIKIYDWNDISFKLNDMVDVLGFLSRDPCLSTLEVDDEGPLPPSKAPRLHVVTMRKLEHINPLVGPAKETLLSDAAETFRELRHLLTQVSLGDELCAEYIIYSLVATVYHRSNGEVQGQLPLNVFNVPLVPSYIEEVFAVLSELTEKSHLLNMDITHLNNKSMIPAKSYDQNILKSGELQLSDNTVLFLDETKLEGGQLFNTGCLNFAALKSVCQKQTISYDFTHYELEYATNINMIIFSTGRSLLPCSVVLKMCPCPENTKNMKAIFEAAKFHGLKELVVNKFRAYLTLVRFATFEISDDMQKVLEESFVSLRSKDSSFAPTDFHTMLVIARLASLCRGEGSLSKTTWNLTLDLEKKRKERMHN